MLVLVYVWPKAILHPIWPREAQKVVGRTPLPKCTWREKESRREDTVSLEVIKQVA